MSAKKISQPISSQHKALLIGVALAGLAGLSVLAILWTRPSCEGIFVQTAPKLQAHLEIIESKAGFAVGHEQIQELSESAQKVGLHLKTCCSVLEGGKLNPEQFKKCIDKASAYDRQISLVAQKVAELAGANETVSVDVPPEKIDIIKQAIRFATSEAEKFANQVVQGNHLPVPSPSKPSENIAALTNKARLINFSSEYSASWKAANILDGKPNVGWCSVDGSLPQTIVIELPRESTIYKFSFDNATQESGYPGISAKDVQIFVSLEAEDVGYREVGTYTLRKGEIAQGFKLPSPVRARWIKLKILSNYGNASYTELMEFRAIGVPN